MDICKRCYLQRWRKPWSSLRLLESPIGVHAKRAACWRLFQQSHPPVCERQERHMCSGGEKGWEARGVRAHTEVVPRQRNHRDKYLGLSKAQITLAEDELHTRPNISPIEGRAREGWSWSLSSHLSGKSLPSRYTGATIQQYSSTAEALVWRISAPVRAERYTVEFGERLPPLIIFFLFSCSSFTSCILFSN